MSMTPVAGRRWLSIPQPTTVALSGGTWRPTSARVVADSEVFAGEARRLQRELAQLGIRLGEDSIVRLSAGAHHGEAFCLAVGHDIEITAGTAAGAFRATRQLLHNLRAQDLVPCARVESSPAVAERGLHVDAARKYFPAEWMIGLLHELADVGINSFQWHFSENEGFRLASERFPEVVSADHITRAQAERVLDAAAELHIDVIPSLDMPGHLRHVLAQHPPFRLPPAGELETDHALDITSEDAVRFAENLIDDMAQIFPRSTRWNLGGDEFVDFAKIDDYPALAATARVRFGDEASGFDLLTQFVNRIAVHLRDRGFAPRAWNDGLLRSNVVALDHEITLTWWTNWHAQMRPVADAVTAGHALVNFNDGLFYYVLGEKAGYTYPTSERIWAADWHPGLFPILPDGARQEIAAPYPEALLGASFSIWSDDASAQTPEQVGAGIRAPLRAMAERAWNGGSILTHEDFLEIAGSIGVAQNHEQAPPPCWSDPAPRTGD